MSTLILKNQHPYTQSISVELPFERITARAIIIRLKDGAILGAQHHLGAKYALLGGGLNDGEDPPTALIRELNEENVRLQNLDGNWPDRVTVDYFAPYRELSFWYLMTVEDAIIGPSENIETRWIDQNNDIWYPHMLGKIILQMKTYVPTLVRI
jgi:hypothetical protein